MINQSPAAAEEQPFAVWRDERSIFEILRVDRRAQILRLSPSPITIEADVKVTRSETSAAVGTENQIAFVRRDVRIGVDIGRVEFIETFHMLVFSVDEPRAVKVVAALAAFAFAREIERSVRRHRR